MTDVFMVKRCGQMMPASENDAEIIASLTDGETYKVAITRPRNIRFHRKYFALLDILYELLPEPDPLPLAELRRYYGRFWGRRFDSDAAEAAQYQNMQPKKNRDRFRKDLAIVCGHFELVTNSKGETRVEAKSISFASMDEGQFSELFSATLNYGLATVAKNHTRADLEKWVEQLMGFA